MTRRRRSNWLFSAILLSGGACAHAADDIKLEWVASNFISKVSFYSPVRITLSSDKPEGLKKIPADVTAPLYGKFQIGPSDGPKSFFLLVDEPDGKPSRLFVDANGNGDLTDDPAADWSAHETKSRDGQPLTNYSGGAMAHISYPGEKLDLHLKMYRFDPHDKSRPEEYANVLFYFRDYGRVGDLTVDGKTYKAALSDDGATGDFRPAHDAGKGGVKLLVDLNANGKFESRTEAFDITGPFKMGVTNFEVLGMSASGDSFQLAKTSKPLPEELTEAAHVPHGRLAVGTNAPVFEATGMDGAPIHFPTSYKGKLVLLDFWATWCPPCRGELPFVSATYEKYHAKGLEIVGVSLDQPHATAMLSKFTQEHNMPWPEIYDDKSGQPEAAKIYSINSIPNPYLIDGDTGKIVAEGIELRGENLSKTIEKAFAQHH